MLLVHLFIARAGCFTLSIFIAERQLESCEYQFFSVFGLIKAGIRTSVYRCSTKHSARLITNRLYLLRSAFQTLTKRIKYF